MTDESLRDALNRELGEALLRMSREVRDRALAADLPPIKVHRYTAYVPASLDLLVDFGAITEAEARAQGWTPPPPPSRRDRLRWRWQAWRERVGRKLGGWIAGVDLSEREEDW